jgi:tripartite ATP-independent transporter DctP family solute receptor
MTIKLVRRPRTKEALLLSGVLMFATACGGGEAGGGETGGGETAAASDCESTDLDLGYVFPDASVIDQAAEQLAEDVSEGTDGQVTINLFPGGQLGSDEEMATAMSGGTQDASILSIGSSGFGDRVQLGNLPYLVSSFEEADALYYGDGFMAEWDRETFGQNNIVGLESFENGFRGLSNSVREVKVPEDVEGLKIRAPSSQIILDIFANWGSQAVAIPFPELYTALEQGTVDGQENGVTLFNDSKLYEVQDYYTDTRYIYAVAKMGVTQTVWDTLCADHQEVIEQATLDASLWQRETVRDQNDAALEAIGEQIDVYVPTDEEFEEWATSVEPIIDAAGATFGDDVIADLKAAVGEIKGQ